MSSKLDQIVKGASPPGTSVPEVVSRASSPDPVVDEPSEPRPPPTSNTSHVSDPLANLPSSPPQIYLNLLILEASLRSQYLTLRDRRRQNTFFLLLLSLWNAYFFYALFLQPREDGSGIGGSIYWMIEMGEKVGLMGGVVTGILIWGTGQWGRGVKWPKRFVGTANRGLRTINCKMIVIRGPWWKELFGHLAFLFQYPSFAPFHGSSYHYIEATSEKKSHHLTRHGNEDDIEYIREEDLASGGDHIKLLLLSKPFSPDFRENWELYRTEYWEKENERRNHLLQLLRKQERHKAKEQGGWLWWTGWRGWKHHTSFGGREHDLEKTHRHFSEKEAKQRLSVKKPEAHSRNSSRSSVVSSTDAEERPHASRRGSSSSSVNDGKRRSKAGASLGSAQSMGKLAAINSRPTPASGRSPLSRASSGATESSPGTADLPVEAPR